MTIDAKTLEQYEQLFSNPNWHAFYPERDELYELISNLRPCGRQLIAEVRRLQADNARMREAMTFIVAVAEELEGGLGIRDCARAALAESDKT